MTKLHYVLITGSNGGIGCALCAAFNNAGYNVIATDLQLKPAEELIHTDYLSLDLAQFSTDEHYGNQFLQKIDQIVADDALKCLINNAAIQITGGVDTLTRADWNTTLQINTLAPFLLSQALLKHLTKAKGTIINISSIHAKLTKKNFVAYATSKAALSGMTRAMAIDIGHKVRVNAIEPAAVDTLMLRASFDFNQNKIDQLRKIHPTNNIAQPTEIAAMAVQIASEGLAFLNGACIDMSGGISSSLKDID